jgi:hypothetical protein
VISHISIKQFLPCSLSKTLCVSTQALDLGVELIREELADCHT